jgi:hypothetical protein
VHQHRHRHHPQCDVRVLPHRGGPQEHRCLSTHHQQQQSGNIQGCQCPPMSRQTGRTLPIKRAPPQATVRAQGAYREQIGNSQGAFIEHSESIQRAFRGHSGSIWVVLLNVTRS